MPCGYGTCRVFWWILIQGQTGLTGSVASVYSECPMEAKENPVRSGSQSQRACAISILKTC